MSQLNVVLHVLSAPSNAITLNWAATQFTAPVAAGALLGTVSIDPPTWSGNIAITGPDAAALTINSALEIRAAAQIVTPRDYLFTLSATP
jgi:hypothetical protein